VAGFLGAVLASVAGLVGNQHYFCEYVNARIVGGWDNLLPDCGTGQLDPRIFATAYGCGSSEDDEKRGVMTIFLIIELGGWIVETGFLLGVIFC